MAREAGKNSSETKDLILTKAIKVFEEKGYKDTSMRDIQEQTKLSKGTLYYHFENKNELFLSCIKKVYQEFLLKWEKISVNYSTAIEKLYAWAELGLLEMKRPIGKSLLEYANQFETTTWQSTEAKELISIELDLIEGLLQEGIKEGNLKKDINLKDISVILLNSIPLATETSIYGYETLSEQKRICRASVSIILDGIRKDSTK